MTYYIIVILGINSYITTQEMILQQSFWIQMLLYATLSLPAIVAAIIGSIWIGRKCGCRWLWNKFISQQKNTSFGVTTPALEDQQLLDTSENFHHNDPSDHMLTSERFTKNTGYGTI